MLRLYAEILSYLQQFKAVFFPKTDRSVFIPVNIHKHLLLLFFFLPFLSNATHIVGGFLNYTYNGGNSYTVTLMLYRDCGTGTAAYPASVTITVLQADGTPFTPTRDFTMNGGPVTPIPAVLPPCATAPPNPPCVEQRAYTTTVNLPASPGGMHLYYSLCCRNNSIVNINNPGAAGETFYAYIPCYRSIWKEDFTLMNGTTVDNGPTAWSRTQTGSAPLPTAQVTNGQFEVISQNSTTATTTTWTSQIINIASYTNGVNLSVNYSEPAGNTLENSDSIKVFYSLNGGPLTLFPVNGSQFNDFNTERFATATGLIGNTVQVFVRCAFGANSPNDEQYDIDMVTVYNNTFLPNSNPVFSATPPLFLCATNPFSLSQAATDADNDSLVYSMYTPYNDAPPPAMVNNLATFTPVTWIAGYSATSPFNSGGPAVTLNSSTGLMTGVANSLGQYVFGVKCSEYRNGVLLSEVVRDYEVNTVTCPPFVPPAPVLSSNSPVCVGTTLNLTASTISGATYSWTGPNSFTSALQNPSIVNVTLAAAGTYSCTATVSGCQGPPGTTSVVVNPIPATPTAASNSPICAGQTLNLTASTVSGATYSWTGPNSFTSTLQNPSIVNATTAASGVYSVTATVNGCSSPPGTVSVTVSPIPAAPTAGSNSPICAGQILNLTASTISGATYSWTGPNSFSSTLQNPSIVNATVAASGIYSVTATVGGCPGPAGTVSVTVNPAPAAPTAGSNSPICAGQTLNLTASTISGATYSWTGPNSFTSTLQNPSIINATTAASGVYSVTATVSGCPGPAGTVSVTVNPSPVAPTAGSNSPICAGQTLNLTASTISGAIYSWTGPNSFSSTLQNPSITNATTAASGVYSVTATVNGCTGPAGTVNVTVNPIPAAPTAGSNSPICAGQTLNLTCSTISGATYSWTGPNSFTSTLQNPSIVNATVAASGVYSVTVTVNGCTGSAGTVSVTVNPTPAAPTAGSNSPICAGSTLNLTASTISGATYSWTGPNSFSSSLQNPSIVNATLAASGVYSVTATVNGCTGPAGTVSVTVSPIPAAPTAGSNSPVCVGNTLNLTASTISGATYSWTGPNSFTSALQNPSIANVTLAASGVYSVTATVAGCTGAVGTVSVIVNSPPAAPTAGSNSPICAGQTLNLTCSTVSGATYSWTGPNSFSSSLQNPSIVNASTSANGTYTVTATVPGCSAVTATVSVTVNPAPAAPTAGSNSPICAGQTLNLTASTISGATYSWTGPNSFTSTLQNPSIVNATTAASGVYSVTVTVAGCPGPAGTVNVVVNPIPAAPTASSNSPVCTGQTLNLTASTISGATYSWTGPNSFSSSLQNPNITNVTLAAAGVYSVSVSVSGCAGPIATVNVVVNPTPAAPTVSSNSPICAGSTLNLTASTISGATYSWTGPNSFSSTLQNPSIVNATTAASGIYTVTVNLNGCSSSPATTSVTVNPIPAAPTAGSNSPICVGSTLNLTCSTVSGATYSWTGPNSFSSSLQNPSITNATVAASGVYSVTVTVNGCTGSAGTVSVTVSPIPSPPTVSSNSPICAGQTLNLTASTISGATYSWTGPNSFSSTLQNPSIINATVAASGIYTVTVTVGGCSSPVATTSVVVNPAPPAPVAGSNSPLCVGATLNLTASTISGATYSWSGPNSFTSTLQNPSITNVTTANAGVYTVTATANGCPGPSATVNVVINSPAIVNAGPDVTVCANNATVTLTGTSSTGSGIWSTSGTGTFSPNNISLNTSYIPSTGDITAGTVTLTLTSTNNGACAPVTDQLVVTITPAPTANAGANQSVCSNNANVTLNGSFTISSGAVWSTSGCGTFSPNNTTMNATYIPCPADTAAGSVTIVLTTTGNGLCLAVTDTMIITYTNAPNVSAGNNANVCKSSPNHQLNGYSSTGSGTWTTSGCGTFSPNANTANATYIPCAADTSAGSVTLTYTSTNNGGCNPVSATITITYTNTPVVNAGSNQTVCANNATINLNGFSSTGTGIWSTSGSGTFVPNNTTLNGTYIPSAADTTAGTVTLTLTATNGCFPTQQSIVITITPAPQVNAGADIFVCANNPNATLNGQVWGGSTTGVWSTSGTGTFNPNNTSLSCTYIPSASDITNGSVTIVLTSTNNGLCNPVSDTLIITYTQPPVANAGPDQTACANNPVQLNGTVTGGGGTGIWTTTNGNGTFSPNNTTLNGTYTPTNSDTLNSPIMLILTSTNNGGCFASSDTMFITVTPGPSVDAGPNQTVCSNNATVQLNGSVLIASGGQWSTSGTGTFNPNNTTLNGTYTPSASDISNGSVTLYLTSTGNGLCNAVTDSMIVTFSPSPLVNAGSNIIICTGVMSVNLNGSVTGGATTGQWTTLGSGTFSPNDTTLNATYNLSAADTAAGTVTLILTSTNNGTCNPVSDTVLITITPIPVTLAGNDTTVCANSNVVLNGTVIGTPGTGIWTTTGSGTFIPSDTTLNATYVPSSGDISNGSVILILTSTGACVPVSDSLLVTFTPAPVVNAGADQAICVGDNVQLNGTVTIATGGQWTTSGNGTFVPNDTTLNAVYVPGSNDISSGTVTLVLTSTGNGICNAVTDSVVITIQAKPVADFSSTPLCVNTSVQFTDMSTGVVTSWLWNFGSSTSTLQNPTNTFTVTGTQTVTLIVSTSAGCSDTITKTIYVNPTPQASFTSQVFCPDSAMFTGLGTVSQGNIVGWNWSFGDSTFSALQDPNHTYPSSGTYTVTLVVTSDSGCTASYIDSVQVVPCSDVIVNGPSVPTGFTPNGDGHNDILYVRGGPFNELDFRVFNEWGNEIFHSTSQSIGWDGTFKGKKQPAGTYVWTVTGVTADNVNVKAVGEVTLMR